MATLISLFSGAGGLDVGLERAGFETVTATDSDAVCVRSLRENQTRRVPVVGCPGRVHLEHAKILHADVAQLTGADLVPAGARAGWVPDLLVGGPPCQSFSSSGKKRSVLDDRGRLFEHFARIARALRPRIILFENVRGLVTARGRTGQPGEVLVAVKDAFETAGYATRFALLNAADYGAAQRRIRLFMLATRDAPLPCFPAPTHTRDPSKNPGATPWVTLGDCLRTLPNPDSTDVVRPSARLEPQLRNLPCGSGLKSHGRAEPTRPGGHWGYRQGTFIADQALPSRTVTASSSQDWIRLPDGRLRRLTVRECAALQGFPRAWAFAGTRSRQFRQVGNAVPVVFGQALGCVIAAALENRSDNPPRSAPLPDRFRAAVAYTQRDHARNASARARTIATIRELRGGTCGPPSGRA